MSTSGNNITFLVSFLIIFIAGCTKTDIEETGAESPLDKTVPSVVTVEPANNKTSVSTLTTLSVSFSEKMDSTTINSTSFTLRRGASVISGTVTYSGTTATFKPANELEGNTVYTGTIKDRVKDLAGNTIDSGFLWSFTTGAAIDTRAPAVISVNPLPNATAVSQSGKITVNFNEEVKSESISSTSFILKRGTTVIPGTLSVSGSTLTYTPSSELDGNALHTVTVTKEVKDTAGNQMTTDYSWSFTTLGDVIAPAVSSVSPLANSTGVQTNVRPSVTFSEIIDPSTVTTSTFTLKNGTLTVAGAVSVSGNSITFIPSSALSGNTSYTVAATKGIKDIAGNPLVTEYTWGFTTGTVPDLVAPTVTAITPLANSTGIQISVKPTITFSELMDPATITASTFVVKQGNTVVSGSVTISGTTATFNPVNAFSGNSSYTVTITTAVKDKAGNPIASAYTWTFTTVSTTPVAKSFANDVVPILNQCNTCHRHNWTPSSTPSTFHSNLLSSGHINLTTPTSGKIYSKVNAGHPSSGVTAEQKATVLTWVREGSKNN